MANNFCPFKTFFSVGPKAFDKNNTINFDIFFFFFFFLLPFEKCENPSKKQGVKCQCATGGFM